MAAHLPEPGQDEKDVREVHAHMTRYLELFNEGESARIAKEMYAAPVQVTTKAGHVVAATTADVQRMFESIHEQIKSRGWTHSDTHSLEVSVVGGGLAFVELIYSRIDGDGKAIEPEKRAAIYVVKKHEDGWRIIALHGHDPERQLSFKKRDTER